MIRPRNVPLARHIAAAKDTALLPLQVQAEDIGSRTGFSYRGNMSLPIFVVEPGRTAASPRLHGSFRGSSNQAATSATSKSLWFMSVDYIRRSSTSALLRWPSRVATPNLPDNLANPPAIVASFELFGSFEID